MLLAWFMNSRASFRILQARTEVKKRKKKIENKNNILKENNNGVFFFFFFFFFGGEGAGWALRT